MKKESKTVKSNKEIIALEERKAREKKWRQEAKDREKETHRKYRHKIYQIIKKGKNLTFDQIHTAFSEGNGYWEELLLISMAQLIKDGDIDAFEGKFRTTYKKKCRYADEEAIVNVIKNYPGNTYDSLYSWSRLYKAEFDRVLGELENTKVIYQKKERYYIRKD